MSTLCPEDKFENGVSDVYHARYLVRPRQNSKAFRGQAASLLPLESTHEYIEMRHPS